MRPSGRRITAAGAYIGTYEHPLVTLPQATDLVGRGLCPAQMLAWLLFFGALLASRWLVGRWGHRGPPASGKLSLNCSAALLSCRSQCCAGSCFGRQSACGPGLKRTESRPLTSPTDRSVKHCRCKIRIGLTAPPAWLSSAGRLHAYSVSVPVPSVGTHG